MNTLTNKLSPFELKTGLCPCSSKCKKSSTNSCSLWKEKNAEKAVPKPSFWVTYLENLPLPINMKTYLESYFSAMTHHLNFISENFFSVTLWALVAGLAAWTLEFIEMYVFSDFRYLIFLLLMLAYDAFAGIQKVKYLHNLDPVKYAPASAKVFKDKTFSKLMYYICVLASLHGLAHLQIKGVEVTIFNAFEYAALITIIATEFWSVQENYAEMGKKTLLLLAYDAIKSYVTTKKPADGN